MITEFTVGPLPADKTAVVLCNGPSLRDVDLAALPGVATFGMNAAYRHWDRIGWYPTHYACLDEVVGLHHAPAIAAMLARNGVAAPSVFLLRDNLIRHLGAAGLRPNVINYDTAVERMPILARQPVTTGSHTVIWALTQGYTRIALFGADCNYVEVVEGAEFIDETVLRITRAAHNPNYYFEDYQQPGDCYNLPNIGGETHMRSWRVAAAIAAEREALVYNMSPASRCDAFDFADAGDFLARRSLRVTARETRKLRLRRQPTQDRPSS